MLPDMDRSGAERDDRLDQLAASHDLAPAQGVEEPDDGQGTPLLALDGFNGPLDRLLALARAQQVDLARLPLAALVEQLATALRQAPAAMPLGQKGDWVVMAAWLLQLRSRLMLPADSPAQPDATAAANQLRERLVALQHIQTLAAWLDRCPQLGRDVFVRGKPEVFSLSVEPMPDLDVIEFLWASLALFDDDAPGPDTTTVYCPFHFALYPVAEARERILRRLADTPDGALLGQLLPAAPEPAGAEPLRRLRRRSAWSSTFIASLELAKQGDVVAAQAGAFQPIHLTRVV